jgi:hypothetical protein
MQEAAEDVELNPALLGLATQTEQDYCVEGEQKT